MLAHTTMLTTISAATITARRIAPCQLPGRSVSSPGGRLFGSYVIVWANAQFAAPVPLRGSGTLRHGLANDQFLDAAGHTIGFVAPAFKETERIFDGIVRQRQVQPAGMPRAERVRRDTDVARQPSYPLVAVQGATGLREQVGRVTCGRVVCCVHDTTSSCSQVSATISRAVGVPAPWLLAAN
jgi:hypothetical protein